MSGSVWFHVRGFDMAELNKLTQRLMEDGWTREQTPPGCRPWREFDGGWTYQYSDRLHVVFETPCGLLLKRSEISQSGYMSYGGIDWTEENDNCAVICPYYDRTEPCELNHPILEEHAGAGCHYENLHFCAVHETDKAYDEEKSYQRVVDLAEAEQERLWKEFEERHGGRVCKNHCQYNRKTKRWTAAYYPTGCAHYGCSYCKVLQVEIDLRKKGNVFYDKKITRMIEADGIFPERESVQIVKGEKLLKNNIPLQLCQNIVKYGLTDIKRTLTLNHNWDLFMNPGMKIEFINFRAEKQVTRDLLQDLEDAQNGITVFHAADTEKGRTELKKQKREAARKKKIAAMEKKILENGLDAFDGYQRERFERFIGEERCEELDRKYREQKDIKQISLF